MKTPLQEGVHYYFNEKGLMVFTALYLRERGYCCGSGCTNCPYTDAERAAARGKKRGGALGLG